VQLLVCSLQQHAIDYGAITILSINLLKRSLIDFYPIIPFHIFQFKALYGKHPFLQIAVKLLNFIYQNSNKNKV